MSRDIRKLSPATIAAAAAGDRSAIAAVFAEADALIGWWATQKARSAADVDDLRSVGRLAVFDALRTYRPSRGHFHGWLTWWLTGRMRNHQRTQRRDVAREQALEWQDIDPSAGALEQLEAEATRQEVRRAIRRLPARMRDVLERRMAGQSLQAIGDAQDRCRENIRQVESRALQLVREAMEAA